jgi:hypothetical protein
MVQIFYSQLNVNGMFTIIALTALVEVLLLLMLLWRK